MASNNMQDIKRRIKSVTSTEHITSAMKLVSAAKLRRAKATFEKTTEYFHYITESIEDILSSSTDVESIYTSTEREAKRSCYIVVTSCRGLCGGFNTNVIKAVEAQTSKSENPLFIAVGTKGRDYFSKRSYDIYSEYSEAPEEITFKDVHQLMRPVLEMYDNGEIDEIKVVYTSFKNSMEQEVKTETLIPFSVKNNTENQSESNLEVEYEPSVEAVFDYLVPKYIEIMLYGAVIESATCEHAARRMAMENATDNANEMLGKLSLFYNRARQAAITDEIIEIVAGSEAQN